MDATEKGSKGGGRVEGEKEVTAALYCRAVEKCDVGKEEEVDVHVCVRESVKERERPRVK